MASSSITEVSLGFTNKKVTSECFATRKCDCNKRADVSPLFCLNRGVYDYLCCKKYLLFLLKSKIYTQHNENASRHLTGGKVSLIYSMVISTSILKF